MKKTFDSTKFDNRRKNITLSAQRTQSFLNLDSYKKLSNISLADVHRELALLYYHNLKRYNEAANELELYLKANPKTENKEQVKKLIKIFRTKAKENKSSP